MPLRAIKGDISSIHDEAIVNAANTSLLAGGGVCGAIHRKAGRELEEYCSLLAPCPVGQAVITPAFELSCRYVIHAVGPRWYDGTRGEVDLLVQAYDSIFRLVADHQIKSISIPAISTGIYRFPLERATEIAIDKARSFEGAYPDIAITFVCFDAIAFSTYQEKLRK